LSWAVKGWLPKKGTTALIFLAKEEADERAWSRKLAGAQYIVIVSLRGGERLPKANAGQRELAARLEEPFRKLVDEADLRQLLAELAFPCACSSTKALELYMLLVITCIKYIYHINNE
jgi:hypothetical protein